MKKRILSAVLAAVLLFGIIPIASVSADVLSGDGWSFDTVTGALTVSTNDGTAAWRETVTDFLLVKSLTVEDSVTRLLSSAFEDCRSITEVTIPDSVEFIGLSAFANTGLKSVTISDRVTFVGGRAFEYCRNLTEIIVDAGNTHYYSEDGVLFTRDRELRTVLHTYPEGKAGDTYIVPEGVERLWTCSFSGARFTSVVLPESLVIIGISAFSASRLKSVTIPSNVSYIGNGAFAWCEDLTEINVAAENAHYTSEDGILFNKDKTTIVIYPTGKHGSAYTVPDSVTSIGDCAFFWARLRRVELHENVSSIGEAAFVNSFLESVAIPFGVTVISHSAFSGCSSLTNVSIPETVTTIERNAFALCRELLSVVVPNSVVSMEESALGYNSYISQIDSGNGRKIEGFTIRGSVGSVGEKYAHEHEFDFVEFCNDCNNCRFCYTHRVHCNCDCRDSASPTLGLPGYVLGQANVTTADALEILKYIVKLPGVIDNCKNAKKSAAITRSNPGTADALEILKYVVRLPSEVVGVDRVV